MRHYIKITTLGLIVSGFLSCSNSDKINQSNDNSNSVQDNKTYEQPINKQETDSSLSVENKTDITDSVQPTTAKQISSQKKALVIGIGEQKDKSWAKINGDKDVPYVKEMLKNFGYDDIRTLVNSQATKAGIVTAFKSLASDCNKGDIVYVHFSGHGQQVTDVNGDEEDGLDESWIPYDAYLNYGANDKGEKHLIDDEIYKYLGAIVDKIGEEGKLMVVVDACHSGGSTRDLDDVDGVIRGAFDEFTIPCNTKFKSSKAPERERWLILTACQDYELNQEISSPKVGKLTYALYMTSKAGKASINEIRDFMSRYEEESRYSQTPELTGEPSKYNKYNIADFFNK